MDADRYLRRIDDDGPAELRERFGLELDAGAPVDRLLRPAAAPPERTEGAKSE